MRIALYNLKQAIYNYEETKTHENAEIVNQLTDYCNAMYGKEATHKAISAALRALPE